LSYIVLILTFDFLLLNFELINMSLKKIPLRTCIGCSTIRPKRELAREVLDQTGSIILDVSGRLSGRGAYLCRTDGEIEAVQKGLKKKEDLKVHANPACLEKAGQKRAFNKAFRSKIKKIGIVTYEKKEGK